MHHAFCIFAKYKNFTNTDQRENFDDKMIRPVKGVIKREPLFQN